MFHPSTTLAPTNKERDTVVSKLLISLVGRTGIEPVAR